MAKFIDGDGHVLEPADLWEKHLPKACRDQALKIVWDEARQMETLVGENRLILDRGVVGVGLAERSFKDYGQGIRYNSLIRGGFDPHARMKDMARHKIEVSVLYPSLGLFLGAIHDPKVAAASCRVYNDWLAEYCAPYPNELIGVAGVPLQDVEEAVAEIRRAVTKLNMKGAFVRPNPYNGRHLNHPDFDPFWATLQDMGVPVALHPAGTPDMWGTCTQFSQYVAPGLQHPINFFFDDQFAWTIMVGSGVLERFPRLKVGIMEGGGGWLPHWFDRMDHFHDVWRWAMPNLSLKPSEYFHRQGYISFDPDERALPAVMDIIGHDRIIWASDYPHLDVTASCIGDELIETVEKLPAEARNKVIGDNAEVLYQLR